MESRKPRNISKFFSKLAYYNIEQILGFLSLDEIFNCLKISSHINTCTKRLSLLENFKKIVLYLKEGPLINETSLTNKYSNNLKINLSKSINKNSDLIDLDNIQQKVNNNNSNKSILEHLILIDLLKNDAKYIKNIVTKLKINSSDSIAIFGFIIEKLILKNIFEVNSNINKPNEKINNNLDKINQENIDNSNQDLNKNKTKTKAEKSKASNILNRKTKVINPIGKLELKDNSFIICNFSLGDGLQYFSRSLYFIKDIIKLDLSDNNLNSKSITSLAKAIKYNFSLKTLILKNNKMSNQGCKNLFSNLISKIDRINLFQLDISNNDIGSDGVESFSEFLKRTKSLVNLNISNNLIGTLGAKVLKDGFNNNTSIKILNFSFNGICGAGLGYIKEYLSKSRILQTLNIGGNYLLEDGCKHMAEIISYNKTIRTLFLDWSDINVNGAVIIAHSLNINKAISNLEISNNGLDKKSFVDFLNILKPENNILCNFGIGFNNFGIEGIKKLNDFMKINSSIIQLNLEGNYIGPREGSKYLLDMLINNKTLKILNVSSCSIGSGLIYISEAIKDNKSHLENLNLSNNQIECTDIETFSKALITNNKLANLQLNNNRINDRGAQALADALKINLTISMINLEKNTMSTKGASLILKSIQVIFHN